MGANPFFAAERLPLALVAGYFAASSGRCTNTNPSEDGCKDDFRWPSSHSEKGVSRGSNSDACHGVCVDDTFVLRSEHIIRIPARSIHRVAGSGTAVDRSYVKPPPLWAPHCVNFKSR